jgi:hypothetical protein
MTNRTFKSLMIVLASLLFALTTNAAPSKLGVGIPQLYDWYPPMTGDAVKQSRPFGSFDKPWDGQPGAMKDGWPVGRHGLLMADGVKVSGGEYTLVVSSGTLRSARLNGVAMTVTGNTAKATLPASTTLNLSIDGDNLRYKVLRPGASATDIWHPAFVEAMKPFGVLRYMDATATNQSTLADWSKRPTLDTVSWQQGVPIEAIIDLANRTGTDVWYCVPDMANDDFIRRAAELFKTGLDPRLRIYWEWSNEVWNLGDFDQAKRNWAAAKNDNSFAVPWSDEWTRATNRIAAQSLRVSRLVKPILGERARVVLPLQVVQAKTTFRVWGDYFRSVNVNPAEHFYGAAGAPYADTLQSVRENPNATVDDLLGATATARTLEQDVKDLIAGATAMGLKPMNYEGGPNVQNAGIDVNGRPILVPAKVTLQTDERYGEWLKAYYRNWFDNDGDIFVHYLGISAWRNDGANFGVIQDIHDLAGPKYRAMVAIAKANPDTTLPPIVQPPLPPTTQPVDPTKPQQGKAAYTDLTPGKEFTVITYPDGSTKVLK